MDKNFILVVYEVVPQKNSAYAKMNRLSQALGSGAALGNRTRIRKGNGLIPCPCKFR